MNNFSFGLDPEFLLKNGNECVSAIPIIGRDVHDPILENEHRFYWDNVLAECAVKPSFSKEEAIHNIGDCIRIFSEIVAPATLHTQASCNFDESQLQDQGAKEAGCQPDICVYRMQLMMGELSPSKQIAESNFRSCGGHIHIGHEILQQDGPESVFLIYLMDLFLGLPSIFIDVDPTSPERRTLYGQAGRFREKEYGIEYRSLGNFWLSSPKFVELIYDICDFLVDFVQKQDLLIWNEEIYWNLVENGEPTGEAFQFALFDKNQLKDCIDQSDKKKGKQYLSLIEDKLPANLYQSIQDFAKKKQPLNPYKEWSI